MDVIVGIIAEKVQRYIYQRIDDLKAKQLHDGKTLSEIIRSSNEVRSSLLEIVERVFQVSDRDFILNTSGKMIFRTSASEMEVKECEKKFFEEVYFRFGGGIFPIYQHWSEKDQVDHIRKIEIIKEMNDLWKNPCTKNCILETHADILFQFPSEKNLRKYEEHHKETFEKRRFKSDAFAMEMDALVLNEESTHGKIAIVKGDLNNMGKIFNSIQDYIIYDCVSSILNQAFCINTWSEKIEESFQKLKGKLLPFYIAGDDVFYAVRVEYLFDSLWLMKSVVDKVNEDIQEISRGKLPLLGMGVGVSFADNHLPIRYYNSVVEKELRFAKKAMKKEAENRIKMGVSIAGNFYCSYVDQAGKGKSNGLARCRTEVEELRQLRAQGIITTSFLHNLLEMLDKEEMKEQQLRLFLYYAMPDIQGKKQHIVKQELYFKEYLFEQLYEKEDRKYKLKSEKIKSQLIPRLKLWLLLTDERYYNNPVSEENFEKQKRYICNMSKGSKIKSGLFLKPLNYIFDFYTEQSSDLTSFFSLFIQKGKKEKNIQFGHRKARFHSSFFYRVKNLLEKDRIDAVVRMFENYVTAHETMDSEDKEDLSDEGKKGYWFSFDLKDFKKLVKKDIFQRSDKTKMMALFDDLILFYKYSEEKMAYLEKFGKDGKKM